MQTKDYYKILGVPRDADEKAIKRAYRKLAREHHPDVNQGNSASEDRFKDISEAYEVLGDPDKRAKYDRFGAAWQQYERAGQTGGFDWDRWAAQQGGAGQTRTVRDVSDIFGSGGFSDFFETLFGGGAGAAPGAGRRVAGSAARGRDLEQAVTVSLDEAYRGATRLVSKDGRRLELRIPAGVRSGSRVRMRGEGMPGPGGGAPGDLFLVVEVAEDPRFERRGDDLHARLPLTLTTAVLGGEAQVETLDGPVTMTIPAGTQNGRRFRLSGKGMPKLKDPKQRGDLLVTVDVRLPEALSDEERTLFERLRELRGG